ncbi:hypothetical protein BHE74_00046609 [Ensete ventricosum]|nr:hypothetical protein BHE74_00046609 [Ensete ventricosum]
MQRAEVRTMWLGTHQESIESLPEISGACQGGAREFAGIESLPKWRKRVRQKKTETHRKIVGGSRNTCQELGRRSLEENHRTRHKNIEAVELSGTMMPSTSVLALPNSSNIFVIGADISGVEIGTTLMQDGRPLICTKALPTLHTRL